MEKRIKQAGQQNDTFPVYGIMYGRRACRGKKKAVFVVV
jgi:hypothetical protein